MKEKMFYGVFMAAPFPSIFDVFTDFKYTKFGAAFQLKSL